MDNAFTRALVGFLALTAGLAGLATTALWGIDTFAGGKWWAGLAIVLVALVAEISIYMDTLHAPIRNWIREPEMERERASQRDTAERIVRELVREECLRDFEARG